MAVAYDSEQTPTVGKIAEISEGWRPYSTWVTPRLRTMLEDEPSGIAGGTSSSRSRSAPA